MIFDRKNEATSEHQIHRFELARGITLPPDYRKFLLEFNGGHLSDHNAFWQTEDSNWLDVEELYGFTNSILNSIESDRFNNFSDAMRAKLLQIGHSSGSGLYIDLREGIMHGNIYILARPANEALKVDDKYFEDDADYEEALFLHPVADNFSAFIAMLGPEPT